MPATLEIIPIPIGSQLVQSIRGNDPESLNDFQCLIVSSENITGLVESSIILSSGSHLVSLTGENSVWEAVIRPQQTAGIVRITIAANAVDQGNVETSKDIRVSTRFPDVDAETATQIAGRNYFGSAGIAVSPTRIYVSRQQGALRKLYVFTHSGTEQTSEERNLSHGRTGILDYFNESLISNGIYRFSPDGTDIFTYPARSGATHRRSIHTRLGILSYLEFNNEPDTFWVLPYDFEDATSGYDIDAPDSLLSHRVNSIAYQNDLLYLYFAFNMGLARITTDDSIEFIRWLNINLTEISGSSVNDTALYRDTLYILRRQGNPQISIHTLDIKKYRPMSLNTKTRIDVQFADEGSTLDLKRFFPDAERVVFDVGYDKPDFLSINSSLQLAIASGAVRETTAVLVQLKGINRIDATETGSVQFYLVIRKAAALQWRDVDELTMRANSTYDLFQLVPEADSIAFRSGRTRLAGSSISNGVFTVGSEGGLAEFTARKGGSTAHTQININILQASDPDNFSDIFRHRVEIAGIDVSADVSVFPSVSESLDAVILNEYRANEVALTLKSNSQNGFKYNEGIPNNFWETNNLNPAGFQEPIKIFVESLVNGSYVSHLLFSGTILKPTALIGEGGVQLTCLDLTTSLRNTQVQDFGTLEKYDTLRQQSDEVSFQGAYMPESSLLPMQIGTGEAWNGTTKMTIRQLALPSEGVPIPNTGYLTDSQFLTSGGLLPNNPLLVFKTQHRSEDVRFLINQLALNKRVYNAEIDLPPVELDTPFILNRGSVSFSVEKTRTTRLLTDWVYDPTNDRLLMLLSNPEAHLSDLLVQYTINTDAYRTLHTFDKDIKAHRIARRNSTNYYILTSGTIPQDRSAPRLPRVADSTALASDSAAEGSVIRIHHYNASTNTLTEQVAEDDSRPPQLGVHYWVGFENELYIDEFEGIVKDYRGALKWQGSNLYYRYSTNSEFGVARVNASGTTSEMIAQVIGNYQNHLNFAFDVTTTGTLYFVYAEGDTHLSTLTIKRRTSGGTESTILTDTQTVSEGAYLGAHEALFHNNFLYFTAPIQSANLGENATDTQADPDLIIEGVDTSESRFVSHVQLNPTSTRLAPGDDIPIRITFNNDPNVTPSGLQQNDLTVYGGTIQSFSVSGGLFVTIRPDDATQHKNIVIILAEDAVTQGNSETTIVIDFGTKRGIDRSARMTLYRCNVTANNPTLTELATYDYVQLGVCNLTVHDGKVHFIEHPPAAKKFLPINPDLDGYWADEAQTQTMGYNIVPESLGALKKINSAGEVESLGNLQHTDRPYNIAATRCLSFDDELHTVMGYGNPDELLRFNSLASKPDNFQHLVFGKKLRYVIPKFDSNGSRYGLLADIAKKVNATLSFQNGLITVWDRNPYRAQTDGATGTGTSNLDFDSQNKSFPNAGYLRIDKEILRYTGIASGAFTGITRGVLQTQIANHANDTPILFLDGILTADRISGNFSVLTDTTRIFNVITNSGNTAAERDPNSIAKYEERPYTLDLGLTHHELAWESHIFENYLENLKDPHQIINLTLKPTNWLEVGQIIGFKYDLIVYALQIVSITKSQQTTQIRGRTV